MDKKNQFKQCWKSITFNVRIILWSPIFLSHGNCCPRMVVLSMHILTLWFLPSFAHYFKKLSAALDSIRINLNSVEENLTFNARIILWNSIFLPRMQFCCPLGVVLCMHILTLWFLPSFAHYFKKLSVALDSITVPILNRCLRKLTFNFRIFYEVRYFFRMQFCCPGMGMVRIMTS